MAVNTVAITLLAYMALLFVIAAWGERRAHVFDRSHEVRAVLLAFSLGVYCTSWTFYGAVGEASRNGWDYLPIYLGPALVFSIGYPLVARLVQMGHRHGTGSLADFLAARFGKSALVGGLSAALLAIASVPYVALQLKSTATSLEMLVGHSARSFDWALLSAAVFAAFAILFGARRPDTSSGNRGLVLAIAFESLIKLIALLAVGAFSVLIWLRLPELDRATLSAETPLSSPSFDLRFFVLTGLAAFAALCLPRQFHMLVVEARKSGDAAVSRWLFPLYLVFVALAVPPIALAGAALLPSGNPDAFVLGLPLQSEASLLAVLTFIGGFSAAAGMITIGALALSTMLVDSIIAPALLRSAPGRQADNLAQRLLQVRRVMILLLILAAYGFYRGLDAQMGLADIGLVSFAGAAQLGPALLFGLFWSRANRAGAMAGMSVGGVLWLALVLWPAYNDQPFDLPGGADSFAWMTLISLAANALAFIIAVAFSPTQLADRMQADRFTGSPGRRAASDASIIRFDDLEILVRHVLSQSDAEDALTGLKAIALRDAGSERMVSPTVLEACEARLARSVGAVAARILIARVLPGDGVSATDVVSLIDETSEIIRTSESAREETERSVQFYMDHMPALISFADADQRIRFANRAYLDYFGFNHAIIGQCIADYLSANEYAARAPYIASALRGERQVFDIAREPAGGAAETWQVLYQPRIEDGEVVGFFGVYQDISARRAAEEGLMDAYATLEDKVRERTAALEIESAKRLELVEDLQAARAQAEAATQSKTRFLAAASHDLLQPLSAARLLTSALDSEMAYAPETTRGLLERIDQSIENADQLLRALLDISRLDAGGVTPDESVFSLDALIRETAAPMAEKAAQRELELRVVASGLWVRSDRGLMMSVLQNLIANAVRYTQSGGVVVGARRRGENVLIQVVDTGPGIPAHDRARVFKEFERISKDQQDGRGLGLGLAIVDRILGRLDHPIKILDGPRGGSVFQISVPRAAAQSDPVPRRGTPRRQDLSGVRVMCLDNDPAVLEGFVELLGRWGCDVTGVRCEAEARDVFADTPPELAIVDYQLDDGETGPAVFERLCEDWHQQPPAILATAERGAEVQAAAEALGIQVLNKPVPPAALRASLTALRAEQLRRDNR